MAEQFNDSNLPGVRAAMHNALKDVGRKFGVRVETSSASYAPYGLTFKVKLFVLDETGEERQKLFRIRCRARSGQEFHPQDYDFCRKMLRLHPKEYNAMTKELSGLKIVKIEGI